MLLRYNLIDIKVNRAYYVYVRAPEGYLFSGGVCNDDIEGWDCGDTDLALARRYGGRPLRRGLEGAASDQWEERAPPDGADGAPAHVPPSERELEIGIREGRSERCVRVDVDGLPDAHLDVGAMRVGDSIFGDTDVALNLDLIRPRWRGLRQKVGGRVLGEGEGYVLTEEDMDSIGDITSEVSRRDQFLLLCGAVFLNRFGAPNSECFREWGTGCGITARTDNSLENHSPQVVLVVC